VIFHPFYSFDRGCAAYLFGCGTAGKGAVVDPRAEDVDAYLKLAAAKGLALTHVIDTHVHADHLSGGVELARRTGAQYCLHESADVSFRFTPLTDGQHIELGNTHIDVIHTPGHSDDSVCLVVTDLRRGPEPWFVLTGDTLFVGAVGRPDLPGHAVEHARQLHASLHDRLLALPDGLEVFPGHFSGSVCGVGLSGKPVSTIGFEKRWNAMLALDHDAFVDAVSHVPPKPADMHAIHAHNRGRSAIGVDA
jgi:glyoxylase-like metal-dependent hydrolase (beta-lactamase superfamily II)